MTNRKINDEKNMIGRKDEMADQKDNELPQRVSSRISQEVLSYT